MEKIQVNNTIIYFDEKRHRFFKEDQKTSIISVTGITGVIDKSAPLMYWAVNLCRDYLLEKLRNNEEISEEYIIEASKQHRIRKERAATKGNLVHEWAEQFIKGKDPQLPEDPEIRNGIKAFLSWVNGNKIKFLSSEKKVYSPKYNYAGILDAEAEINGKLTIVDFKTSNGVYNEMRYQVAAYQNAMQEMTGKKYDQRILVRFDKETGEFHEHFLDDFDKDFEAFVGALKIRMRGRELDF